MYKSIFTILTYITIALAYILPAQAQSNSTEGTEFYVTFTTNYTQSNVCQIRYVVSETCQITAQYGDGTYLEQNQTYQPGVYTQQVDTTKAYIRDAAAGESNKMIHITSTRNIGVYAIGLQTASTDATTVLPVSIWGKEYTVISNSGATNYGANSKEVFITVIAPTDGTQFTIYDKADNVVATVTSTAANPVYNYVDANLTDLTGYTVESDRNVAVFSSVRCAMQLTAGAGDHSYEQLYPTNTAGNNFFLWNLSPLYDYSDAPKANTRDKVVILALEDNTKVTKKVGAVETTLTLNNRHDTIQFFLDTAVHVNNSAAPVWITSDKPVIVNHLLGYAPTIKWWSPIEQTVIQAMISPFVPTGGSAITWHQLHVMIPEGTQQNMIIRETRSGVTTEPGLTFYTNTSNPGYVIATRQYAKSDDVRIELLNPAGFVAYMIGGGERESYIFSAGSGAFDMENYFTIATNAQPPNDVHYSATHTATHTFDPSDQITVKRTLQQPFTQVRWLIHGQPYTGITENTNINNTLTIPASALSCGMDSIVMSVRYKDANVDSVYTGYVWIDNPASASDISVTGNTNICEGQATSTTLTATSAIANPVFRWYASQTSTATLSELDTYSPTLSATTTYYVSVSGDGICENKPGERKEITVTVAPCVILIPVNPHLRSRVVQ
jgi:hypothetical protein